MQMFMFVFQMAFIKLEQSHKLNKELICALLSIYIHTDKKVDKQRKRAQMHMNV